MYDYNRQRYHVLVVGVGVCVSRVQVTRTVVFTTSWYVSPSWVRKYTFGSVLPVWWSPLCQWWVSEFVCHTIRWVESEVTVVITDTDG